MKYLLLLSILSLFVTANTCKNQTFTASISTHLRISDILKNISTRCELNIIIKDTITQKILDTPLRYLQVKDLSLTKFLDLILKEHDLNYSLQKNVLRISYLITRTFRIHYIAGQRISRSNAHITIANSNRAVSSASEGMGRSRTGISIESQDSFFFWKTLSFEIERILNTSPNEHLHYTAKGTHWYDQEGKVWSYNPLSPIINPQAGMVTVTGNHQQIANVKKYIHTLSQQIKRQVLIDVKILSVRFNQGETTGIDWKQFHSLQNVNLQLKNQAIVIDASHTIDDIIMFLGTQGKVSTLSSPKIMTLNNQPALISVGKELFYKIKSKTISHEGNSAMSSEGETIDSVFAGILLDITPEINSNSEIILKINPSISDTLNVVQHGNNADNVRSIPPDLIRRQISSVIKVKAGEQVILGGLISSKEGLEIQKIPLLGDLPLLEYLFKHTKKTHTLEELVLIITPHIVNSKQKIDLESLDYESLMP